MLLDIRGVIVAHPFPKFVEDDNVALPIASFGELRVLGVLGDDSLVEAIFSEF